MSLFIGGLSYKTPDNMNDVRLGVLSGSIVSALLGYGALMLSARRIQGRKTETAAAAE